MEVPCSEDSVNTATVYCACKFPLAALCHLHAEKHTTDRHIFHFPLPPSASQVITSKAVYLRLKSWLTQLNSNYDSLREKLQLFVQCEEQIEAGFQEILHFFSETNIRLKQEVSVRKEGFHAAIEKSITETRTHALEKYEPVDLLSELLWKSQPWEIEERQLFSFQTKCIQENLPLAFQVALTFDPGLEYLNLDKCTTPLTEHIEELNKQLTHKDKRIKTLNSQLKGIKAQQLKNNQQELEDLKTKLQETERQVQQLQTDKETEHARCLELEAEVEFLNNYCEGEKNELVEYREKLIAALKKKDDLEALIPELQANTQRMLESYQTLRKECEIKEERYSNLKREKNELQREAQSQAKQLQESKAVFQKSQAAANEKYSILESRLRKWGIDTDPPTEFQEPDYTTPQSRTALATFGPYSNQDDELVLFKRAPVTEDEGVYIGQWNSRGQQHGYGKYLWRNGSIYEGQWRNGQRTGRGRYILGSNGEIHVGEFLQNKKEGFGTCYYADGGEYSGAWVNNAPRGVGSFKFGGASQGDRYFGEYLDDRDGIGAYFWADGHMYAGSWKAGKKHGKGLQVWDNGNMYSGDYEDDAITGTGCLMQPNGDVYRGQLKRGMKNGQGQLITPGDFEEGTWVNDELRTEGCEQQ